MWSHNLWRWLDPRTWPWFVYVWAALLLAGGVKPAWRWLQRRRAANWPSTHGRIESAGVRARKPFLPASTSSGGRSRVYEAELVYTYGVLGRTYAGMHTAEFGTESEAEEFVWDLKDKPIEVHYNPNKPSISLLSDSAIKALLESRAPLPEPLVPPTLAQLVPQWLKPILWIFVVLSAVGLAVSLWVHIGAVEGRRVVPETYFWILHVGVFVVWIPAVLVSIRLAGNTNRKDYWKVVLRGSPAWMRYMVYGFTGYAMVNFFFFMTKASSHASGSNPPAMVWRGFSGHWMAFYSAALAILYSAARSGEMDQ